MKKNKIFHDHISGNYKLSEFSALLGIIELKRINKRIRKRNQLAKIYYNNLNRSKFLPLTSREIFIPIIISK